MHVLSSVEGPASNPVEGPVPSPWPVRTLGPFAARGSAGPFSARKAVTLSPRAQTRAVAGFTG